MNIPPHERIAPVPQWIVDLTAASKVQNRPENAEIPLTEYDLPHNIDLAISYLKSFKEHSVEKGTRDDTTYKTACIVRDHAVSREVCLELMLDYWIDACEGDWGSDNIQAKVYSAYTRAQNRPGKRTPEDIFASVALPYSPTKVEILPDDWKYLTLGDILERGDDEPDWAVENYFPERYVNMLFGDSGTMKSFIALDLALCIATGTPWHGNPVRKGTVIIVLAEGNYFYHFRIKAWLQAHPEITTPADEIPLVITPTAVPFDSDPCLKRLLQNADHWPSHYDLPLSALFIDTLSLNLGTARSENDNTDAGAFISQLKFINDRYQCSSWFVHHCPKSNAATHRGANAFRNNSDTNYLVEHVSDKKMHPVMTCTKMKDFAPPPKLRFKADIINLGATKKGKMIDSIVLKKDSDGNADPSVFEGSILNGDREELLSLLKKPRSNNITGDHSIWSMPGFPDRGQLKVMLEGLIVEGLIVLDNGNFRRM